MGRASGRLSGNGHDRHERAEHVGTLSDIFAGVSVGVHKQANLLSCLRLLARLSSKSVLIDDYSLKHCLL